MAFEIHGVAPLLQVYDMPTSVRFYRDQLGFEVVSTSPEMGEDYFHWVMLRLGEAEIMLNTAYESNDERPAQAYPPRIAAHRDTGLFFACPDVDGAYEQLRGRDVDVNAPIVTGYGMKQMYLLDPDGYQLCFQWAAKAAVD